MTCTPGDPCWHMQATLVFWRCPAEGSFRVPSSCFNLDCVLAVGPLSDRCVFSAQQPWKTPQSGRARRNFPSSGLWSSVIRTGPPSDSCFGLAFFIVMTCFLPSSLLGRDLPARRETAVRIRAHFVQFCLHSTTAGGIQNGGVSIRLRGRLLCRSLAAHARCAVVVVDCGRCDSASDAGLLPGTASDEREA